jgi:signal transduction histidine kinase
MIAMLAVAMQVNDVMDAKLLNAKDTSEELTRAKGAFMANMSHELRTPLNAIMGMAGLLLLDKNLTSEQEESVEIIKSSGERLLSLINDILVLSSLEKGTVVLKDQPFDLHGCVDESIDRAAPVASKKGLNVAYAIDTITPKMIRGDPVKLRQILGNLLDNAVKFTERGGIMVLVSSEFFDSEYKVHFAIKDTGVGVPGDRMNRLFKSFSQVDDSISRKYTGAGLGLAISKNLVEMMGGRIWAESNAEKGSTFHFTIRAKSVSAMCKAAGTISV